MPTALSKITVILFLCLFSSACCIWGCIIPSNPKLPQRLDWVKDRLPTDGEGAVGCSSAIYQQKDKATRAAITELAMQNGVDVEHIFKMVGTESSTIATFKTNLGTLITIKAKTHEYWSHPANVETCVWLKEIK